VSIIAAPVQDGVYDYHLTLQCEKDPIGEPFGQYTPDFMAAEND